MTTSFTRGLASAAIALIAIAPAGAKDKKPVDPNKRICRSDVPTGSRMTKSTCHTAAEWADIDAANAATVGGMDNQRHTTGAQQ